MRGQNENKCAEKIDKYLGVAAIAVSLHLSVFQGSNLILLWGNRRRVRKYECENSGESIAFWETAFTWVLVIAE